MLKWINLLCGATITLFLVWFAVSNYRDARPMAEESLFGLAHSLHAAIENSVQHDPSLHSLSTFHTPDLAYFALVDRNGVYRFHSNSDLIGTSLQDKKLLRQLFAEEMTSGRVRLATGEEAYELITHIHLPSGKFGLIITLHTHRADAVVRRAQFNMLALFSLLACGWVLAIVIYRFALRAEQHQLEMAKRENLVKMGEMGAMLAHEIRNPLAGIKGFAQLIEKKPAGPRTGESAHLIVAEVRRLESLVTELLEFARSDEFPADNLLLCQVIDYTLDLVRSEIEQGLVALHANCPGDIQVRANRDRLTQVMLNIVRNGVQAMPEGGSLIVACQGAGSNAVITITDSGRGISPDDLPRVFEPFFTTKPRGSGLGLALCKKIIEEHHGSIDITSNTSGTTVTLTLPRLHRKAQQ